jgi:hypothetical protein
MQALVFVIILQALKSGVSSRSQSSVVVEKIDRWGKSNAP